jgi:hypothetical protein
VLKQAHAAVQDAIQCQLELVPPQRVLRSTDVEEPLFHVRHPAQKGNQRASCV